MSDVQQFPGTHPVSVSPSLDLVISWRRDTFVIQVRGSLDRDAHTELEAALRAAESSDAKRILLDLNQATSLDARSLHAILKASRRSKSSGHRLQITRGHGHVADVFRLTALDRSLPLVVER